MAKIRIDTGAIRASGVKFAAANNLDALSSALLAARIAAMPIGVVAPDLSSQFSSSERLVGEVRANLAALVGTVTVISDMYEQTENALAVQMRGVGRVAMASAALIGDAAALDHGEKFSDMANGFIDGLWADIVGNPKSSFGMAFIANCLRSYYDEGIGTVEDAEKVVDMFNGEGDVYEGFKGAYSIAADIFGLPSFIPDALDRGEARNKIARDFVTSVTQEHGLGWGIAAAVPAALWELGDFLLQEMPRCAEYAVKWVFIEQVAAAETTQKVAKGLAEKAGASFSVHVSKGVTDLLAFNSAYTAVTKTADVLWRGCNAEGLPSYSDAMHDQISRVTSRLTRIATSGFGGR